MLNTKDGQLDATLTKNYAQDIINLFFKNRTIKIVEDKERQLKGVDIVLGNKINIDIKWHRYPSPLNENGSPITTESWMIFELGQYVKDVIGKRQIDETKAWTRPGQLTDYILWVDIWNSRAYLISEKVIQETAAKIKKGLAYGETFPTTADGEGHSFAFKMIMIERRIPAEYKRAIPKRIAESLKIAADVKKRKQRIYAKDTAK